MNAYTTFCSDCGEEVAYTDPRRPRKRCKPCRKLFKAAQERERRAEQKARAESLEQMELINGRLSNIFEKLMIAATEPAMVNRLAEIEDDPKWRRVLLPLVYSESEPSPFVGVVEYLSAVNYDPESGEAPPLLPDRMPAYSGTLEGPWEGRTDAYSVVPAPLETCGELWTEVFEEWWLRDFGE